MVKEKIINFLKNNLGKILGELGKKMRKISKNLGVAALIFFFVISPLRIDLLNFSWNVAIGEAQPLEELYITENTTWNRETDLSQYESIYVEWGATLTIEKGTQLAIRHLYIYGNVIARGTKEEKIKLTGIQPVLSEDGISDPRCYLGISPNIEFGGPGETEDDPVSVFEFVEFSQMGGYYSYDTDNCIGGVSMKSNLRDIFFPTAHAAPREVTSSAILLNSGKIVMNNCDFVNNAFKDVEVDMNYNEWNTQSYLHIESSNFYNNPQDTALAAEVINTGLRETLFNDCFNDCKSAYPDDYSVYGKVCTEKCNMILKNDPSWRNKTKVVLKNNWYGHSSGPKTELTPGAEGEKLVGDYTLSGFSTTKIENTATVGGASNVLFLPGLEASRLYAEDADGDENQLWEPNRNVDVEKLFLDKDGKSVDSDIYTRDVIDEVNVSPIGQKNIYKSFLSDLNKWKNDEKIINDYSAIPYDWRLTLEDILEGGMVSEGNHISYAGKSIAPYIIKELRRLAGTSKTGKVTIIAHSNGGLVAKALTNKLGAEATDLIDKIVFVAVPQAGTPQAIGGLLHGFDQGLPTDWLTLFLSPKNARILANNMPSAYQLLPSEAYFGGNGSETNTPVVSFEDGTLTQSFIGKYGTEIKTSEKLQSFLSDGDNKVSADSDNVSSPSKINSQLLTYGENIHQSLDDNWTVPAPISVYQIAGFGEETLGGIKYFTGMECVKYFQNQCFETKPKLQYTPEMVIDGDGTVVAPSALAMSADSENVKRFWVDLDDYNDVFTSKREHADILEVSELRNFIKNNILTKSNTVLPKYLSNSKPASKSEKRLRYILHSPLALSAHDASGNEISATASTISSANYKRFGEVQYISLPAVTAHTLVLDGLAEGSFTLEMQEVENEAVIAETTFAGIPTSDKTKVTMEVADGTIQGAAPLVIDFAGDGTPDFSLKPKIGEIVTLPPADQTPPEARIFFDTKTNLIVVEGIDENPTTVTYTTSQVTKKNQKPKEKITTATLKDQAGNTTVLVYAEKLQNRERRIAVELKSVSYNGSIAELSDTVARYNWNTGKKGVAYAMFATHLRTASIAVESHYRPKKNITIIMTKPQELDDSNDDDNDIDNRPVKQKLSGMVIPALVTKQGAIEVKY
jgi:hypothetical protein